MATTMLLRQLIRSRRPSQVLTSRSAAFTFLRQYETIKYRKPIFFNYSHELPPLKPVDPPPAGIRRIQYAFDPANTSQLPPEYLPFDFLNLEANHNLPKFQYANPNHPPASGVQWPTSFSHSFQSKYWKSVESSLAQFLRETYPQDSWAEDQSGRLYIHDLVDSVVSFVVNVFPTCPPARLRALANLYAVIFMHDDSVDLGTLILQEHQNESAGTLSKRGFNHASSALLSESPALGMNLIESLQNWADISDNEPGPSIQSFEDYLRYRVDIAGVESVFRSVEFAYNIHLSEEERESLKEFTEPCAKHFALTNDLYSHAKEAVEMQKGKWSANTVSMLEGQNGMSSDAAKGTLRQVIWKIEGQIYGEYKTMLDLYGEDDPRVRYAQGVVIALTGNMFYSATCRRYASAVDGSEIIGDGGSVFVEDEIF